jgi:hypothetical protein
MLFRFRKSILSFAKYVYLYALQGELDEGLKKLQDLVKENPRDFRPYLCQVCLFTLFARH